KDLIRRGEAEVGEHDNDFLLARVFAAIPDDQRRRQQKLLLQSIMRVHPVHAATAHRKIVVGAAARRNRQSSNFRDAVLPPGRSEAMPVDKARLFDTVLTRTRNGLPTSVVIPKVPSGWRMQNTEADLPF